MARPLTTNKQIDAYIRLAIQQAQHHAPGVAQVILPLSHAVRARITLGPDQVEVFERLGNLGRTCWLVSSTGRWVFSYAFSSEKIELRQGSTQGRVLFGFDNQTSAAAINRQTARV